MKRLFKFKYPKIILLVIFIILAYIIFTNAAIKEFIHNLGSLSYLGVFIAGFFFTFGFSSPLSAGFFIVLSPENLWLSGIIGGLGALTGDLLIFKIIRFSFVDEFEKLRKEKIIKKFDGWLKKDFGTTLTHYLIYAFAGFLIASPLPDEFGVIMLAGLTRIKISLLAVFSFVLNTIGILILLAI